MHSPILFGVESSEVEHDMSPESFLVSRIGRFACKGSFEYSGGLGIAREIGEKVWKAVIGESRTKYVKVVHAFREGSEEVFE